MLLLQTVPLTTAISLIGSEFNFIFVRPAHPIPHIIEIMQCLPFSGLFPVDNDLHVPLRSQRQDFLLQADGVSAYTGLPVFSADPASTSGVGMVLH